MKLFKKKQKIDMEKEIEKQTSKTVEIASQISDLKEETNKLISYLKNNNKKIETQYQSNFSTETGEKNKGVCPSCWVKGDKPYNCGFHKCLGHKLHVLEISKNRKLKLTIDNITDFIKELDRKTTESTSRLNIKN